MTELSRAVFLSYASQDVEPASRIAEALRQRGIDVWFDQSELRGGDVWDQRIREQIRDCALFVPVISAHTQNRTEGYFRLEWKLAVDRSHLMASEKAFLLPVVIDSTPQTEALVPERFRDVQWTRIPDGEATQRFVDLVKRLLDQPLTARSRLSSTTAAARRPRSVWRAIRWTALGLIVTGIAYLTIRATGLYPYYAAATANRHAESRTVIAEKSIAVLSFADLSEKKDQEYFSDGLAEELLEMLAKTPGLHVIARTSSFSFKGKSDVDPHYAAAIAGLASAEYRLADITADPTGTNVAKRYAAQAIIEGPDQAEGYAVSGTIRSRVDWDWWNALADLQKAVALSPGDAEVQHSYGTLLGLLGRFPEATAALREATRLDPLSPSAWDDLGLVLMASRDYQGAGQAFGRELEIQPEDPYALDNLGTLQLIPRDPAAALATYGKIIEVPLRDTGVAMAEHSLGHKPQSQQALETAIATGTRGFASQIADVFAWRDQKDEAFEWLERAHEQHDGGLAELNTDVLLASLHDDPRFAALRRKINLPD